VGRAELPLEKAEDNVTVPFAPVDGGKFEMIWGAVLSDVSADADDGIGVTRWRDPVPTSDTKELEFISGNGTVPGVVGEGVGMVPGALLVNTGDTLAGTEDVPFELGVSVTLEPVMPGRDPVEPTALSLEFETGYGTELGVPDAGAAVGGYEP